jgi:integral membrane protein (TIGR01906 family)
LKFLRLCGRCIFILCLPVMLLSGSLAWGFNSSWILEFGFQKYDVAETTQLSSAELTNIAHDWVRYINSTDQLWRISLERKGKSFELFNPEEQMHFRDVKQLVRLDYVILIAAFCLVFVYALISVFCWQGRYRRPLAVNFLLGCGLTFLLLILLGIASLLAFDQLFLQMHHLIFTNPYWSAEGYMLLLFPGGFWFDAAMICVAFMAGITLILAIGSFLYLRRSKLLAADRT